MLPSIQISGMPDFAPWDKLVQRNLEYGEIHFLISADFENCVADVDEWRIVEASFVDSLQRPWALIQPLEVERRHVCPRVKIPIGFGFDNFDLSPKELVEGAILSISMATARDMATHSFVFAFKKPMGLGPIAWDHHVSTRESLNDR